MFSGKSVRQHGPDLASLRPAIVEGKLMTDKRAQDSKYVVLLAEELRNIEKAVEAAESPGELTSSDQKQDRESSPRNATWFHQKCAQLDLRIRHLERSADHDDKRVLV